MLTVGLDVSGESPRSGSFAQVDQTRNTARSMQEGVEVMNVGSALRQYGWLENYWWNALRAECKLA